MFYNRIENPCKNLCREDLKGTDFNTTYYKQVPPSGKPTYHDMEYVYLTHLQFPHESA